MSRPHDDRGPHGKRPYSTPQLRRVSLVPDEAVLASCKNASVQGPQGASIKCTGTPSLCSRDAS
ncbi:MAG TPA: hypothetical protein VJV75_06885 [Candidatus Polarisedimenticolia bacterium]|nr:hypothetical protein [Candidatus Polarisedimenticolia bacterium]